MVRALIDSKDLAEALSFWATTLGIFVAVTAGVGAYWMHIRQRNDAEWDRAREVYAKFLELATNNPEFLPHFWSQRDPSNPVLINRFYWYMGQQLWACEDILTIHPEDDAWRECLRINLNLQADYLSSEEFAGEIGGYYPIMQKLIYDVINEWRLKRKPAVAI